MDHLMDPLRQMFIILLPENARNWEDGPVFLTEVAKTTYAMLQLYKVSSSVV